MDKISKKNRDLILKKLDRLENEFNKKTAYNNMHNA
jgi:hypothetical protein